MNRFLNRQKQLMLAMAGVLMLTVSCSQDVDNELGTTDAMDGKVGSEVKLQFATNYARNHVRQYWRHARRF